jgi:hypothetical protein
MSPAVELVARRKYDDEQHIELLKTELARIVRAGQIS